MGFVLPLQNISDMSIICQFVLKDRGNYRLFSSSVNNLCISGIRTLFQHQLSYFCENHVSWLVKWQMTCGNRSFFHLEFWISLLCCLLTEWLALTQYCHLSLPPRKGRSKGKGHPMTCVCRHREKLDVLLLPIHNLSVSRTAQCSGQFTPDQGMVPIVHEAGWGLGVSLDGTENL